MAQPVWDYDQEPKQGVPSNLSSNEQRIANAVVAALKPSLKRIEDKVDSNSELIKSNGKRLDALEQQMRGVHKIFEMNEFIIPSPDDY